MDGRRFGEALRAARERARLTQQQVADCMSARSGQLVSQQRIANWERGKNRPADRDTSLLLCQVLHEAGGLCSREEIERVLTLMGEGALHPTEVEQWFPNLIASGSNGQGGTGPPGSREGAQGENTPPQQPDPDNPGGIGPPNPPPPPPAVPDGDAEWHERVILWVRRVEAQWGKPERLGHVGAIGLATGWAGSVWHSPARWDSWEDVLWVTLTLWGCSVLLTLPPSPTERDAGGYPLRWLRLFRFSGAVAGLAVLVGLFLWVEGVTRLLLGAPLPTPLVYLCAAVGVAFAHAGGLNLQFWMFRKRHEEEGRDDFYRKTAGQVSGMMLLAHPLMVGAVFWLYQEVAELYWYLWTLTPLGMMVWFALRGRNEPAQA